MILKYVGKQRRTVYLDRGKISIKDPLSLSQVLVLWSYDNLYLSSRVGI